MGSPEERMKKRRGVLGLTQKQLAQKAGVGVATIQRLEAGKPIRRALLNNIAEALDCSVEYVTEGRHVTMDESEHRHRLASILLSPSYTNISKTDEETIRNILSPDRIPDLTREDFKHYALDYILNIIDDPVKGGWFQIEFCKRFPEFISWVFEMYLAKEDEE
jgi:transcriptional regulator with XRE-family HTH domain